MAISQKKRQQVFLKFGGLCAYTGKPLDLHTWQVDHICPQRHYKWFQPSTVGSCHDIENLLPALRIINHYKRALDLEGFRHYILTLHTRLKKLPKKTVVPATARRKAYLLEVAELFGVTEDKPFSGVFYFETLNKNQ